MTAGVWGTVGAQLLTLFTVTGIIGLPPATVTRSRAVRLNSVENDEWL